MITYYTKKIKYLVAKIISGWWFVVGGLILTIFAWQVATAGSGSGFLKVDFYDIGQGDAIFIEGPKGEQILVDGGPDSKILEKLGKELNYFDRYIDVVVATHPDKDHINGLIDVLKYYDIGEVWVSSARKDTSFYNEFMRIVENKNISVKNVVRGDNYSFDGFNILILNPKSQEDINTKINNTSIVTKIIYKNISFLLTGDLEKEGEQDILQFYRGSTSIDSDILKVAHHGSKSSSTEEFIKSTSPELAIIQVGKDNPYHHPHYNILERFDNLGIPVLRNDLVGNIKITSDGDWYAVDYNK